MNCRKETFNIDPRSTFAMKITLKDREGNLLPINTDFRLLFLGASSGNNKFEVSQRNGVKTKCFVEDGKLFARFENYNLSGLLMVEIWEFFEDENAKAGHWRWVSTKNTNVKITRI